MTGITHAQSLVVFRELIRTDESVDEIIDRLGFRVLSPEEHAEAVLAVISEHPQEIEKYHHGKTGILDYLVGQVMRQTHNACQPTVARELLKDYIDGSNTF